jgi:hypothetical protein
MNCFIRVSPGSEFEILKYLIAPTSKPKFSLVLFEYEMTISIFEKRALGRI